MIFDLLVIVGKHLSLSKLSAEASKLGSCMNFEQKLSMRYKLWVPLAKGGDYSPYYADLHLVVNWKNDGEEIKSWVVSNASDPTTTHWSRNR
jgi:hypothetical protein